MLNATQRSSFGTASLLAFAALLLFAHSAFGLEVSMGLAGVAGSTTAIDASQPSNVDKAMKVIFEDPVSENMVTDSDLLDIFEQDGSVQVEQTTGGRYITLAHYFQLPAGVGARHEMDYIPVPEGPVIENSRVNLRKIMGTVEMTGDTMRRCKQGLGAFLDWGARALPDLVKRVNHERDRMLIGFGTGVKARVNDADSTYPTVDGLREVAIDSAFGVAGYTNAFLQFMEGERIVFAANPDGSSLRNAGTSQSAKVVKIDQKNSRLYVDSIPTGTVDNDYIFAGDASGVSTPSASGENREVMGLLGMVDDGQVLAEFQGLTRADYTLWNSVSVDAQDATLGDYADGSLNEDLLTYADDETIVLGGGEVSVLVTSRSGLRSYWRSRKDNANTQRVLDERVTTGGRGKQKVWLGDRLVELRAIRKLPPEVTFGLSPETLKRWMLKGWEWDDTTGAIWRQVTDGTGRKDAFYAYGYVYMEAGCIAPRKNFVIRNLVRA
jgi:hypothetical protein